MNPLITLAQIQAIFKMVSLYHDALLVELLGDDAVTPERLLEIKRAGLYEESRRDIVARSFDHGRASFHDPRVLDMGDKEFEEHLKAKEIPMTKEDKATLSMLRDSFKTYTTSLGEGIKQRFSKSAMEANKHAVRAAVTPGANEILERRSALAKLAKDMADAVRLEVSDAVRVVETETNNLFQNGRAQEILKGSGEKDPLVYKLPRADACEACVKAYTVDGKIPRVFRLSELISNGSNVGRKRPDRLPVLDSLHPYCVCLLLWMPPGFDFNSEGVLVPARKAAS